MTVPPIYVDKSSAGDHEVFEDTDRELQDLVRLEVQWASNNFMANRMGKQWKQRQTVFFGTPRSLHMVTAAMKLKDTCSLEEKL